MFGMLKLVVAGAILALAGGYVISGGLVTHTALDPAADGILVVAADGSGEFTTIAEAVAAAAEGHTVLVAPGTYSESVVIDKDITLTGDGPRDEVVLTTPAEGGGAITDEGRALDLPTA